MPIAFDFQSIKQRILNTLSSKTEWASFLDYGTTSLLIDSIAQELAYEVQYREYLVQENWWGLARNKSSLLVEAPVHGYKVPRKKGALGTLKVSIAENFDASPANPVYIPKYFQFSNGDTFVVATDTYVISPGDNYIELTARQGKAKALSFLALGNLFETKEIIDDSVDNSLYNLYVNDVLWTKVSSLFEYTGNDLVYELITDSSFNKVTLKFGNNIFGKKLNTGDSVLFQYITTLGSNGNISSVNNITVVESQAYDSLGTPTDLYVTNTTAFTGGVDYPSIEEIRTLSPKIFQTGSRASTRDDYEAIIKQLDYISKVMVWGAYETNTDNGYDPWTFIPTEENVVHIAALNTAYDNLSYSQKLDTTNSIYEQSNPTDIISYESVEKINLVFNVNAIVQNSSYVLSQVKASIDQVLQDNFNIANTSFGENIYSSDLIRLIDEIPGIRNHNIYTQVKKDFLFSVPYIVNVALPLYPLNGTKVKFYIKETQNPDTSYVLLASSDANGIITGEAGYSTGGSSINTATGIGTLIVGSGLTLPFSQYSVRVIGQAESDDLILNKRNYIFAYDSSNITVSYPF